MNPTDRSAIDALVDAEEAAAGMSVVEYADALEYERSIVEQHFDPKGIELATIHGAKGRQWPMVILGGIEEGTMPHNRAMMAEDPASELEGERRLAYVAMTRAADELVLMFNGERSRFINEAALSGLPVATIEGTSTGKAGTTRIPAEPPALADMVVDVLEAVGDARSMAMITHVLRGSAVLLPRNWYVVSSHRTWAR